MPNSQIQWRDLRAVAGLTARDVLDRLGVKEPPINVADIAERVGVHVRATTTAREWSGALDGTAEVPVIWYRHTDGQRRQRFTIAHELGHLLLHPLGVMYRDSPQFSGGRQEVEANKFAADLMMPAHMVRAEVFRGNNTVRQLSNIFDVSERAMTIRLDNLGLSFYLRG